MDRRRTVLLVHRNPDRLDSLNQTLSKEYETLAAGSPAAGLALVSGRTVDAVVADGGVGGKFLDDLELNSPLAARVLLTERHRLEDAVESMSAGHAFHAVSDTESPEALAKELHSLFFPRSDTRHGPVERLMVSVSPENAKHRLHSAVLDISNRGLAFRLDPGHSLEKFLPGARIEVLNVLLDGEIV